MSCCHQSPKIILEERHDTDRPAQDTEILRGESVECYGKRAGNSTGLMHDKTDHIPNKILNTDIPITKDASVNVEFSLTLNSTRTATIWQLKDKDGSIITNIGSSVVFSGNTLSGIFTSEFYGKNIQIKVTASDTDGEIDTRGFVFSPAIGTGYNEIQFLHPLPGAIVTSPYGPRAPPTTGASSMHGGADFAYIGNKINDVLAAADGEVIFTGYEASGAGNYVKIKHLNGNSAHLCTTVYMHLEKIYTKIGQKVSAGQKIGLEGNTGHGTGVHLHFECRLPNNTKINPVPLIRGTLQIAGLTNPDNTAVLNTLTSETPNGVLTKENVQAKENGCEPNDNTSTLTDPNAEPITSPSNNPSDPFEQAWFFSMQHEIIGWSIASLTDQDVLQGLIETTAQRHKTGYINDPDDTGGETKFGVAQGPNRNAQPPIVVRTLDYETAKSVGFNKYWKRGPIELVSTKPKTAIMLFDICYNNGVGSANAIRRNANIDLLSDDDAVISLADERRKFYLNIVSSNSKKKKYIDGWLKRNEELLSYVQNL